ncbi:MAG: phosphomannomutase/phosphoglucomutase [Desulfobacterales bacterium]|nr:MAG: phosphomannomutase/phosphoglucomutase [Desulfobacterales bacterium]
MSVIKNRTAFKECDIRGKYPDEVDEALFRQVGFAFGRQVRQRSTEHLLKDTVVVGGDHRLSTPALKSNFLAGLSATGVKIIDLGVIPTSVVYWAKSKRHVQASAAVTASHNPAEFNGLKIMNGDRPPTPEEILSLANSAEDGPAEAGAELHRIGEWADVIDEYQDEIVATFTSRGIESLAIVVDPGNGCQAGIASEVYTQLGARVTALHDRRDGLFRERHPDCAIPEHLAALVTAVRRTRADLGIAFDGDGDRLAVVDNRGRILGSERLGMILLRGPLRPQARDFIILDIKCSMQLERTAAELDGRPLRCRSGHAYMKKMVLDRQACMGVELSGHIFLQAIEGRDDPLYTSLLLSAYLAGQSSTLADWVDQLPQIYMTPDVRLPMASDKIDRIIDVCRQGFAGSQIETVDGVRLLWEEGWLLVRRSITEPKITLRIEGERPQDLRTISQRLATVFPELQGAMEAAVAQVLCSV